MTILYPVYKPYLFGNEKKYVNQCLETNWISSQGEFVERFENAFAKYLGKKYALSCTNGTVALHLALLSLNISTQDEVIVPSFTYVAAANAVKHVGATPIFVDSEPYYFQIDSDKIEAHITHKTKAIIVVHTYGHPANIEKLVNIAKKYNLYLIEDCAEAIGAQFNDQLVGTFGDIATFSFYGNKTITTGEGGMVVTDDEDLCENIFKLKGQGVSKNRKYYHDIIGYNYRMTNICCALGLAQLENIEKIIEKKIKIANWYKEELKGASEIYFHGEQKEALHTYWLISILVRDSIQRDHLMKSLSKKSIDSRPFFIPMHQLPIYQSDLRLPVAENLSLRGINLPSYPALSREDVRYISNVINKCLHL